MLALASTLAREARLRTPPGMQPITDLI